MLSVLIVNWNTKDLLKACLESLFRFPPSEPMEVIVVDNASTDGSAEAVIAKNEERRTKNEKGAELIRVVSASRNLGYAGGNNAAFALASGDWLLTLNPDTEVFEDTLQTAIDTLKRRPKDGALGARQISPDGTTQRSIRGFPTVLGVFGALLKLDRAFPTSAFAAYTLPEFDYESEGPAPQPMGTFLLFRREALAQIGDLKRPFDEGFPIFFNEVDLLYRLKKAGWGCAYDPQVRILHHGGESTKQIKPKMIWESHRSLIRYWKKHAVRWWSFPFYALVFGVIWLGAWVRARKYDVGFRP